MISFEELKCTKYEKARLIGARALQISQGAPLGIKVSQRQFEQARYSPVELAKLEFEQDKILLKVKRCLPRM